MKHRVKLVNFIIMLLFCTIMISTQVSLADDPNELQAVYDLGAEALRVLKIAGAIIAVMVLALYGIKWFLANPQEKAALKEKAWIYIIGAIMIFGGPIIVGWIIGIFENIFSIGDFTPTVR